jgi:hypothetical protein
VERLNTAMGQGRVQLNRTRSAQRRREEEALLRAEQDREFREAVELDQRAQEQKQRVPQFPFLMIFLFLIHSILGGRAEATTRGRGVPETRIRSCNSTLSTIKSGISTAAR